MSKRDFGTTKCLLHFDFPYFNEPNDGLDDDVGIETWSKENTNVRLYGEIIPSEDDFAPKFGYRCAFFGDGAIIGTNTSGIWNLNSSGDYEIEFFVYPTDPTSGARYLLRLCSSGNTSVFTVGWNASGYITVLCPDWGITSAVTSSTAPAKLGWRHILLRISNNTLKLYIEGTETISQALTSDVTLSVDNARIGYNATGGRYFFCIDEFVFRHSAGTDAPTVPTHPYSGVLDASTVGGYKGVGSLSDGTVDSASGTLNSYGLISAITDAKTFTVSSWVGDGATAEAGREVMIHITAPISTDSAAYPLVGLYAFAKIDSVDGTSVVLSKDITIANGYDFTLDSSLLSTYYVQAITVPRYDSLTVSGSVTPATWSTTAGGGIVALRTTGDCTVNGSILTHGKGAVRYDLQQMTNSKLIDRFLCSQGGGVFISCGGTLTIPSTARLGASWSGTSGAGQSVVNSSRNAGAGYGGSGYANLNASGGAGGVGGGGGGGSLYNGGDAGNIPSGTHNSVQGTGGIGRTSWSSDAWVGTAGTQGRTAGGNGIADEGSSITPGGGAGGNSGYCDSSPAAIAGSSIILIAKRLNANASALSTGGQGGKSQASGGGGTGFCYIACERQVSA